MARDTGARLVSALNEIARRNVAAAGIKLGLLAFLWNRDYNRDIIVAVSQHQHIIDIWASFSHRREVMGIWSVVPMTNYGSDLAGGK